jgi:hypothetical protein
VERAPVLERFQSQLPVRFNVAEGPCQLNAALIDTDPATGLATEIRAICEREPLGPDEGRFGNA